MEQSRELSTDEVFIKSLSDIVLDNLRNDQFGAEEMSRQVGVSRSQIHRKLQKIVGKSLTQFIREIRLTEAYKLLQKDIGTAAEISYLVGFNSPTYFNSSFHEYFGFPPGEVRRRKLDGEIMTSPVPEKTLNIDAPKLHVIKSKPQRKKKAVLIAALFLILLALTTYSLITDKLSYPFNGSEKASYGRKSIAVLPFQNEGLNQNMNFTNGVMADIHYNLSMMGDLKLISKTSMARYRENKSSVKKISRELDVDYLLEGNVQNHDNQVRIHVSLIDGKKEEVIWTDVFQRDMSQYFEVQSEIAQEVASALYVTISPEEIERINEIPTKNQIAHSHYINAREAHSQYWIDADSTKMDKAIEDYRKALHHDSTFAKALSGLGLAYYDKLGKANLDDLQSPFWDSIYKYSEKAILADNQLSDAHLLKGLYDYGKEGKIEQALHHINLALKYDPNSFFAYQHKGFLLSRVDGKILQTIISLTEASYRIRGKELAPIYGELAGNYGAMGFYEESKSYLQLENNIAGKQNFYLSKLAFLEFSMGNYSYAIDVFKQSVKDDTSRFISPVYLIAAGQYDLAYKESIKYLNEFNGDPWIADIHRIGFSFWQAGDKEKGLYYLNMQIEKCLQAIKDQSHFAQRKYSYYDLAATYAFLGEKEKAIEALAGLKDKQSYPIYVVNFLKKDDPFFDSVRRDPRFMEIVDHVERRYLQEHEKIKSWLEKQ